MLVLTRHRDEEVVLKLPDGRLVVISVVEIRGDKIRLGFTADLDIEVDRREVFEKKLAESR